MGPIPRLYLLTRKGGTWKARNGFEIPATGTLLFLSYLFFTNQCLNFDFGTMTLTLLQLCLDKIKVYFPPLFRIKKRKKMKKVNHKSLYEMIITSSWLGPTSGNHSPLFYFFNKINENKTGITIYFEFKLHMQYYPT